MKKYYLDYPVLGGYAHHWLATGLITTPIDARPLPGEDELAFRGRVLTQNPTAVLPFTRPPLELEKVGEVFWLVQHCQEDHLLEIASFAPTWQHLQRWAHMQVMMPSAGELTIELSVSCAATLWVNGIQAFHSSQLQPLNRQDLRTHTITQRFKRGANSLYLLLEDAAQGPALLSVAMGLSGKVEPDALRFLVQNAETETRKAVEALYDIVSISQSVFTRDDRLTLKCANRLMGSTRVVVRMQATDGSIYAESFNTIEPGATLISTDSINLPAGLMTARLLPPHGSYYDVKLRAQRDIPFLNAPDPYWLEPQDAYESRLTLAIREAVRKDGIYAEIARMTLGWWDSISHDEIRKAIHRVEQRAAGCLLDLIGLIGMTIRMGHFKKFPAELLPEIEAAVTSFPYEPTPAFAPLQPGETDLLLLAACQVLAGQKFSRAEFASSARSGLQERKTGECRTAALLHKIGSYGWREGHSRLEERVVALAHLADLAKDETVSELSAVLLDQIAFTLAQYSFQGTFGVPQLLAVPTQLKTGRLAPAATLNRLLFGTGGYTGWLAGVVSLGVARRYSLPELIRSIAYDSTTSAWTVERSARPDEGWEASMVAYKTPDFLLASLQDYYPGQPGPQVHAWQATLGPEAVVFTNHPTCLNQAEHRQAGDWCGCGSLPRIAQWKDALICLYNLPETARLGFTHAYFPVFAFDEYRQESGWVFARKGKAYLALYASTGSKLSEFGDNAGCELRASGSQVAWLCQVGRQDQDGEFKDFCARTLASSVITEGLTVNWHTIRGDRLQFSWTGAFHLNGQEQPLHGGKRFEGPFVDADFPTETMDIGYGDQMVRLSFA